MVERSNATQDGILCVPANQTYEVQDSRDDRPTPPQDVLKNSSTFKPCFLKGVDQAEAFSDSQLIVVSRKPASLHHDIASSPWDAIQSWWTLYLRMTTP